MNTLRLLLAFVLILGPVSRIDAQSKASDTLKRAGLLPDANAKPPTISKQEGELVQAAMTVFQTDRGREAPVPTLEKPIYYVAYDGGFSANIRGVKAPPPATMVRILRDALSSAGYEPATSENRPSLAIFYRLSYENTGAMGNPFSEAAPSNSYVGAVPPQKSVSTVTISAYDYEDLTRSTDTLLWVTRCAATTSPPWRNPEETYLAFVTACAPYFGALLTGDTQRKTESAWVAVPHRDNLADQTPAFAALSPAALVLDQRALREMERTEQAFDEQVRRQQVAAGTGWPARDDARNPSAPIEISPALSRRIAHYLAEKNALQDALTAHTHGSAPGAATGRLLETFVSEHTSQISALTLTGEAIRRTIVRFGVPNSRDDLKNKPLDALLREFAPEIRASTRSSTESKTSDALEPAGLADKRDSSPDEADFQAAQEMEARRSALPPALAARVSAYQAEKMALQDELAIRLKSRVPSAVSRETVESFNAENASRIAALERMREGIRTELGQLLPSNSAAKKDRSLDDLLREFAADAQQKDPNARVQRP